MGPDFFMLGWTTEEQQNQGRIIRFLKPQSTSSLKAAFQAVLFTEKLSLVLYKRQVLMVEREKLMLYHVG